MTTNQGELDSNESLDSPPATTPPAPQRSLPENYEMIDKIGQGTYGTVYRARDMTDQRIVAIKKILLDDRDEAVVVRALSSHNHGRPSDPPDPRRGLIPRVCRGRLR